MKKKIADRWVRALRSGKFKQTTGNLEQDGMNCCLGVLCRLAEKSGVIKSKACTYSDKVFFGTEGEINHSGALPEAVMQWAGMKSVEGDRKNRKNLVEYNDDLGYKFPKIADIIEKNYKEF